MIPDQRAGPAAAALSMLLALVIANLALQPLTEPDFGWHLRTGLDLLQDGGRLPPFDPYSHTMPDWPWVEHAWLTDVLIGLFYRAGGSTGTLVVILFFGVITATAWVLAARCCEASLPIRLLACALSLWVALPFLGARTQMITLLGLAMLMWILRRNSQGQRTAVWWIPPLFLLWANLHGGFTAGILFLALVIGLSWATARVARVWPRIEAWPVTPLQASTTRLAAVTGVSGLLTFINPYGWRLHQEILDSLSDRFMIETLQEWHPLSLETLAGRLFITYLALLGAAMVAWYRRIEPIRWGILAVFLVLACRHLRNIPVFLILSLPLMAEMLQATLDRVGAQPLVRTLQSYWTVGLTFALGLFLLYLGPDHFQSVWQFGMEPATAFRRTSYPIEAVEWVRTNRERLGARPVHDYQYGGFLLWWLPQEKIFIDGRMPAWRIGDRWIFRDYMDVRESDPPNLTVLEKYAIDWAFVKRDSPLARTLDGLSGWRKEYEDPKAVIYSMERNGVLYQTDCFKTAAEEVTGDSSCPPRFE